tara:strand:- start:259 stop:513 length:255 start_codon:yes stop_codon:yes gene_type:complete
MPATRTEAITDQKNKCKVLKRFIECFSNNMIKTIILRIFTAKTIRAPVKKIFNLILNLMSLVKTVRINNKKYAEAAAQAGMNFT